MSGNRNGATEIRDPGGVARVARRAPTAAAFTVLWTLSLVSLPFVSGCDAFNSAFVNALSGGALTGTLQNAPGHVVLAVINNAEVDERLIQYLDTRRAAAGEAPFTDAERRALRPRMRLRVRVVFIDGTSTRIEFITGSRNLVDPEFNAQALPDLNQNDLDNAVVTCEVASIRLEPGSQIEVFVPVEVIAFDLVTVPNTSGVSSLEFVATRQLQPQFVPLNVDVVDADGNIQRRRNIGIRDTVAPIDRPICGSVVPIVIEGVLSVPFLNTVGGDMPSFSLTDTEQQDSIGGRYEFRVPIQ